MYFSLILEFGTVTEETNMKHTLHGDIIERKKIPEKSL